MRPSVSGSLGPDSSRFGARSSTVTSVWPASTMVRENPSENQSQNCGFVGVPRCASGWPVISGPTDCSSVCSSAAAAADCDSGNGIPLQKAPWLLGGAVMYCLVDSIESMTGGSSLPCCRVWCRATRSAGRRLKRDLMEGILRLFFVRFL